MANAIAAPPAAAASPPSADHEGDNLACCVQRMEAFLMENDPWVLQKFREDGEELSALRKMITVLEEGMDTISERMMDMETRLESLEDYLGLQAAIQQPMLLLFGSVTVFRGSGAFQVETRIDACHGRRCQC